MKQMTGNAHLGLAETQVTGTWTETISQGPGAMIFGLDHFSLPEYFL